MVAVHLCIWHLTNFDNASAGHGWLARARQAAERSSNLTVGGWVTLLSGYFAEDRSEGLRLLEAAAATAAVQEDVDLATMATADLGLSHVVAGDVDRGMPMLDEAMAATFAEPRGMLEVVVWASCDMLAACTWSMTSSAPRSGAAPPIGLWRPTAVRSFRLAAAPTTAESWSRPGAGPKPSASWKEPWPWPPTPAADHAPKP